MSAAVNVVTGEILELENMTDEEIVREIRELEEVVEGAKAALNKAKNELLDRMERDGARLRMTPEAKVRVHYTSRVRDKKLVEKLYEVCPDEFKEKCFRFDIRPLKTGLNELAKLGSDWSEKVDAVYEQVPQVKIEWKDESADPEVEY